MIEMRWSNLSRVVLSSALVATAWSVESIITSASIDPVHVLDCAAGDPQLITMAHDVGLAALHAALTDSDPLRQRAAARLLATGIIPPAELLKALVSCPDADARRLGAAGLLAGSVLGSAPGSAPGTGPSVLSVKDLLRLGPASVVAPLLIIHPDPWADGVARPAVMSWLKDPATCAQAAGVLMAQADVDGWGSDLVALLEAPATPEPVVAAVHAVLERLTKTQRSRDAYAGHRDMLAADWRDTLAARAEHPTQPPADVLVLIAELPAPAAITKLLERGPTALPALEQAMASADRARRKALQPVARLVARGVTPTLWTTLGADGLADLDNPDVRARSACLRKIAAVVRSEHDRAGLLHLVRWLDDSDTRVRACALDLLVRLSDDKKDFGSEWELGDDKLFLSAQTTWRLRRSLRDGGHDERLAALVFVGSLSAAEVANDVVGMVIDADPVVADAALDALGHLSITDAHLPVLTRLALDASLPTSRRVLACTRIAGISSDNEVSYVNGKRVTNKANPAHQKTVEGLRTLVHDPLPAVANAAAKALLKIDTSTAGRKELYTLLAGSGRASLLSDHLDDEKDPALLLSLLPHLADDSAAGSDSALALARGLIGAIASDSYGEDKGRIRKALQEQSVARAKQPTATLPERLLGLVYGIGRAEMIAGFSAVPENRKEVVWNVLVDYVPRHAADWLALVPLAVTLSDDDRARLVRKTWTIAALDAKVLMALANADQLSLMHPLSEQTENDLKTLQLDATTTVVLTSATEPVVKPGEISKNEDAGIFDENSEDELSEGNKRWRLKEPMPVILDADVVAIRTALMGFHIGDNERAILEVMIAIFGGPAPKLAANWKHELEAWSVLTKLYPELRPLLAAGINAADPKDINDWSIRSLVIPGNPDLLPAISSRWGQVDDWQRRTFSAWMLTLSPAALRPHLLTLVITDAGRDAKQTSAIIRRAAPVPLPVALRLLSGGKLTVAVEPFTDAALLTTTLDALTPAMILAQGNGLAAVRTAGPTFFDAALKTLCTKQTRTAAAWLRTGLPLQYLGKEPYEAAYHSEEPHLWVVGAALHLKEGTLSPGDFLGKLPTLPATALADALTAVQRRIADRIADQGPALAAILAVSPAGDVAAWLELSPACPAITAALKARLAAGVPVAIVAPVLASKLRSDRDNWESPIRELDATTNGQLKIFLGALLDPPPAKP